MEDLWAFNTETVVRAVAVSRAPVVTGIGHETDLMLADFAADVRAPTPSAAAEVATPDRQELAAEVQALARSLARAWQSRRAALRQRLRDSRSGLAALAPQARLAGARQRVDELASRAILSLRHGLELRRAEVATLTHTLQAIGPLQVLGRGYAVVRLSADGALVRSLAQLSPRAGLEVQVSDGTFAAEVTQIPARAGKP